LHKSLLIYQYLKVSCVTEAPILNRSLWSRNY